MYLHLLNKLANGFRGIRHLIGLDSRKKLVSVTPDSQKDRLRSVLQAQNRSRLAVSDTRPFRALDRQTRWQTAHTIAHGTAR